LDISGNPDQITFHQLSIVAYFDISLIVPGRIRGRWHLLVSGDALRKVVAGETFGSEKIRGEGRRREGQGAGGGRTGSRRAAAEVEAAPFFAEERWKLSVLPSQG
jgi:hypothetical protein